MVRLAAAALVLATNNVAFADADATFDLPVAVHGRLDGQTAALVVQYAIDVSGPEIHTNELNLTLPDHGVVTGVIAFVDGAPHRLALAPTDNATKLFNELAELPGGSHRRWAIEVSQASPLEPTVLVEIATPHAARVRLDLELSVPTCFSNDVRYASVPKEWTPHLDTKLVAHRKQDDLDAACEPDITGGEHQWLGFPTAELAAHPFGDQRVGVRAGRLDLYAQHVARTEIALAGAISQVPNDLATVFVVDASRSMTGQQLTAQKAIIESYLAHAPRSRVQIIAYARKPRALLPSWSLAAQAQTRIGRELGQLATANGSNLDLGIRAAGDWLSRVEGTRRIVVFTDELLAMRYNDFAPASLVHALPTGTLVHAVALADDTGAVERDDLVTFGELAVATEGIGVRGRVDDNDQADALELVRPIALDKIKLVTPGWDTLDFNSHACPIGDGRMVEGTSCTWWGDSVGGLGIVRLDALEWNHRVTRIVRPDPTEGRALARSLQTQRTGFDDKVTEQIERAAYAVNAVWSMLGTWGGADGYSDVSGMIGGLSSWGCGCGGSGGSGSFGIGHVGTISARFDLKQQLAVAVERCHIGTSRVQINVELTLSEIVDVEVTTDDSQIHDCVVEAVWNTDVIVPTSQSHTHASAVFGG